MQELRQERSNSTTLISYYIKGGPNNTSSFLKEELSQSANIKSKQTRDAVQEALRGIQRNLKGLSTIPANGLAIFAGPEYF
jgi:peptide chain release factor subunit 1